MVALTEPRIALAPDPRLVHRSEILFATTKRVGLEPQVRDACVSALGAWDECLLWVTRWGVWANDEDWPMFYALRQAHGERTSLDNKPGHLFAPDDARALHDFLLAVLFNGWDAHLLPARNGKVDRRLRISHDGWVELLTQESCDFRLA